jgi:hypothetical protein
MPWGLTALLSTTCALLGVGIDIGPHFGMRLALQVGVHSSAEIGER